MWLSSFYPAPTLGAGGEDDGLGRAVSPDGASPAAWRLSGVTGGPELHSPQLALVEP